MALKVHGKGGRDLAAVSAITAMSDSAAASWHGRAAIYLAFGAGYIQRSIDELPKQGAAWPWRLRMNYVADVLSIRHGALADSAMEFRRPHAKPD